MEKILHHSSLHQAHRAAGEERRRRLAISLATLSRKPDKRADVVANGGVAALTKLARSEESRTRSSCAQVCIPHTHALLLLYCTRVNHPVGFCRRRYRRWRFLVTMQVVDCYGRTDTTSISTTYSSSTARAPSPCCKKSNDTIVFCTVVSCFG